jgi:hypothetical protein
MFIHIAVCLYVCVCVSSLSSSSSILVAFDGKEK